MNTKLSKLKLRVVWCKNFLGLAINQLNSNGEYFLTRYYFWPKTEAWEQLKIELSFKPWIQENEKVKVLNLAAEVMNFWRANRNTQTFENVENRFSDVRFVKINT